MSDTPDHTQADDAHTNDAHANDAYTIGVILRGAREANGESIEDVARLLRINWRYLQALEEGEFDELPGMVFALGFIRTYADHLGVDSASIVTQYKALSSAKDSKSLLDFPEPIPESGMPGGAIMFAGIVVAILAYGGWYLATEENSFLARMVSPVPEYLGGTTDQDASDGETMAQPVEQGVPEEATEAVTEEAVEEVVEGVAEQPQEVVAEEAAAPVEDVAPVVEAIVEPVTEAVTETPVEVVATDIATEGNAEEAVTSSLADTAAETESVQEPVATEVQEEVQEIVVEKVVVEEAVTEDVVAVVSETVSPEPVTEPEPEPEPVPVAEIKEETDSHTLNEEQLQAVQEVLSADDTAPATPVEAVEVVEETVEEVVQDVIEEVVESTTVSGGDDAQVAAIPTAEATVTETAAGRIYGEQGAGRIIVRAKINSWIQVRDDVSGELLLTRLLKAGDEYHAPDRAGLSLLTGNAGALEILVDGTAVPAIGATGDVRRDVALDADRLMSGDAAD